MDKIERTKQELNDGLKNWVSIWLFYWRTGRVSHTKDMKNNIDRVIKAKDLDKDTVYFCYGDLVTGDKMQKKEVYDRAEKQEMVY